jgi:hypothetical protein
VKRKKELKKFLIWFFGFLPEEKRKSLLQKSNFLDEHSDEEGYL